MKLFRAYDLEYLNVNSTSLQKEDKKIIQSMHSLTVCFCGYGMAHFSLKESF